jgi:hypothetical protein
MSAAALAGMTSSDEEGDLANDILTSHLINLKSRRLICHRTGVEFALQHVLHTC